MQQETFLVAEMRNAAFAKLPDELRRQLAFRHFYTQELDPTAGSLSVKFFSLLIYYFCAMFRLEGRRRQYEERPSDTSGAEFAKAHAHAKMVFQHLSSCYSVILLRYSVHSKLPVRRKIAESVGKNGQVLGGGYGVGTTKGLATHRVVQEAAFHYASDEMVFFEVLYQIAVDLVLLAFDGDVGIQSMAVAETNRLFRSKSFLFFAQQRESEVKAKIAEHDRKAKSVLENSQQLIELLTPLEPKLSMKHATHQRTPFLDSKLPGSSSVLKFLRVRRRGLPSAPSAAEKNYSVEMNRCPFPQDHRAQQQIPASVVGHPSQRQAAPSASVTEYPQSTGGTISIVVPSSTSPELEMTKRQQQQAPPHRARSSGALQSEGTLSGAFTNGTGVPSSASAGGGGCSLPLMPTATAEEWLKVDMANEIAKIYQALANGVVVTSFGVPPDLLLTYDVQGVLMLGTKNHCDM